VAKTELHPPMIGYQFTWSPFFHFKMLEFNNSHFLKAEKKI
jgi:hypothetical protein